MTDKLFQSITSIVVAIIGVAILSVLVSKNANTAGVISAASKGLATDLQAAVSPITGGQSFGMSLTTPSYFG